VAQLLKVTATGPANHHPAMPRHTISRKTRCYRTTPLDLSIAKAQIDVVFEVKYLKYTLFILVLLRRRKQ